MKKIMSFMVMAVALVFAAPQNAKAHGDEITKEEVMAAQEAWAQGIVNISKVYMEEGDYRAAARKHIEDLYAYGMTDVLFKPTLAADDQFRETFDEALSYFVGGDIKEDSGFAIRPWKDAKFDGKQHIAIHGDYAVSMGNYFFTPAEGGEPQKVEFTFGYIKDDEGNLRINVHHSSLPYSPK